MLGGFKWHSNRGGGGGEKGGLLTQVSQGSNCSARGTHRSHHTLNALHLLLELQGNTSVFGLELHLETHFLFPDIPSDISILAVTSQVRKLENIVILLCFISRL